MKTVDPQVYELADAFVTDVIHTLNRPLLPSQRAAYVDRAAQAMQQAIEDECDAIREELQGE